MYIIFEGQSYSTDRFISSADNIKYKFEKIDYYLSYYLYSKMQALISIQFFDQSLRITLIGLLN